MPTTCGHHDSSGYYCIWGSHGKHYYYKKGDKASMERARKKAEKQGSAAHASGYVGSEDIWSRINKLADDLGVRIEQALPSVKPNESEQTYVSRCIEFETRRSPDRPEEQIARMCYEKYREATGGRKPSSVKAEEEPKQEPEGSSLKPEYMSTAKPYYRLELETLDKELQSMGWDKKRLLIDIKGDGLRLSFGKVDGKPFILVDPETLKEKSPDVSDRLPLIVKELETIPDNTVLDGEFIAVKGDEVLHRSTANSLLNATHFSPEKLADYAYLFVFDVLFFKGQDIRNQPLHERLEFLQQIEPTEHIMIERESTVLDAKADAYVVKGSDIQSINTVIDKILNDKIGRPSHIAEGVMVKDISHFYETPTNHGWSKVKKYYEVDTKVWDKKLVKGQDDVWNYFLGIEVTEDYYNKLPDKIKVPNKYQMFFGKSNSTSVKAEIDDVLRVASEEVLKTENDGYPYYRGYISRALEVIPEKDVSDSLEVLDKLSQFQPKRMPMSEITRIENQSSDSPLTQEDIVNPPSGQKSVEKQSNYPYPQPSGSRDEEPRTEEPGEEILQSSYNIPSSIDELIEGSIITYKGKIGRIVKILK